MYNAIMDLTPKQEKFAQCVALGMSQAASYREAFNVKPTTKAETVQANASRLMSNSMVSARTHELKEQLSEKALWTREMSVKALAEAMELARATNNAAAITGAVKELNAMHGFNEPKRLEITGKDGAPLIPAPVYTIINAD